MIDDEAAPEQDPRQRVKDELWGMGVTDAQAERWIERWRAEAARRGLASDDPSFWDRGLAWIDETRGD